MYYSIYESLCMTALLEAPKNQNLLPSTDSAYQFSKVEVTESRPDSELREFYPVLINASELNQILPNTCDISAYDGDFDSFCRYFFGHTVLNEEKLKIAFRSDSLTPDLINSFYQAMICLYVVARTSQKSTPINIPIDSEEIQTPKGILRIEVYDNGDDKADNGNPTFQQSYNNDLTHIQDDTERQTVLLTYPLLQFSLRDSSQLKNVYQQYNSLKHLFSVNSFILKLNQSLQDEISRLFPILENANSNNITGIRQVVDDSTLDLNFD